MQLNDYKSALVAYLQKGYGMCVFYFLKQDSQDNYGDDEERTTNKTIIIHKVVTR